MKMIINRKLKTLKNKTGEKITRKIKNMLADHDKYKKCYFWSVNMAANQRRQQEFEEELVFILNDITYEWKQSLEISCKNFYWSNVIYVNDKKSTITKMKNLIK